MKMSTCHPAILDTLAAYTELGSFPKRSKSRAGPWPSAVLPKTQPLAEKLKARIAL